ncbi:XdhC family protein [Tropicimonas sp. S265A]|uniref:XdhC family protein n=1 Tax=Tropicimonas sp. S265A TaxID=3415134 RepID=UPI003C7C2AF0
MSISHDQLPEQALAWHRAGKGAVIATVVETWGSAPRPVGSQLVISGEAELAGSVSGGCVEGAVVAEALDAIETGQATSMTFGVSDDEAFAVGLACGGQIRVIVEPVGAHISEDLLAELVAARAARTAVALAVNPDTWERRLVRPGADDPLASAVTARARADKSGFEEAWFLGLHNPPLRMVVVGAVHIAQPLLTMARLAGYDPVLVDPREAFASAARFPGETLVHEWPDAALAAEGLDARTAVVTLTHDPKLDDPAIKVALASECFYLGCLGSTRTHAKRVARLEESGFTPDQIGRIHAPVGLNIGAKSPAEIAISVMAQITERLRRP